MATICAKNQAFCESISFSCLFFTENQRSRSFGVGVGGGGFVSYHKGIPRVHLDRFVFSTMVLNLVDL
jgi:hypothetical protein